MSADEGAAGSVPDSAGSAPRAVAEQVARLGFVLDEEQLDAMHRAVTASEPALARLRARPFTGDGRPSDPAHGDRWLRPGPTGRIGGVATQDRGPQPGPDVPAPGVAVPGVPVRCGTTSGVPAPEVSAPGGSGRRGPAPEATDPAALDVTDLVAAFGAGALSPVDVVAGALDRLERAHAALNCTIAFLSERAAKAAEESARRWAEGTARPLEGVPFGVKDVIDVAGVPTTAGSWVHGEYPAARSAEVVRRLEAAGAIAVSKDATTEFAVGGPNPPRFGSVRNPWDRGRWAGGSSTGTAAAVAARALPFGLGTDVGGSIRLPSAWCGLTGLKPTAGAIPRSGVFPLSWTTETVGPIARSARDVELLFRLLRGPDGVDPRAADLPPYEPAPPGDLRGLRIAVPGGYLTELCDGAVRAGIAALVDELVDAGAQVVAGEIPSAAEALAIGYLIVFAEAAELHRIDAARWAEYDPVVVSRISQGITTSATDYLRALQFRAELQQELAACFAGADLVVVPTCPSTAPRLPDGSVVVDGEVYPLYAAQSRSTMLANLTGAPGLAVPTGLAPDGCPTSAQLIAPPHREVVALRAARVFQARTGHHLLRPAGP